MQKQSKQAKKGQNLAFSILKSTPAQKKYTTVGCGGCDKYELWFQVKSMILLLWISVRIMYTKVTILQNVPNNCFNSFGSCSGVRLLIFKCQIYFISIYCFCISLTQFATNIIKFPFEVASILNEQTLEENFKIVPIIIKLSKLKHFQRHNGPEG